MPDTHPQHLHVEIPGQSPLQAVVQPHANLLQHALNPILVADYAISLLDQ